MVLALRDTTTVEECAAALRRLTDADLRRLEQLARIRVTGLHALDWEDLLNEAIVRMLDGSRRWPRDVSLVVFLRETMRSIASAHWRRLDGPVMSESETIRGYGEAGEGTVDLAPDVSLEPQARTSAAETLDRIERLFSGDDDALKVISGMVSGKSPGEFQREACMSATRYASTQRRIRRRLTREFPEGEG